MSFLLALLFVPACLIHPLFGAITAVAGAGFVSLERAVLRWKPPIFTLKDWFWVLYAGLAFLPMLRGGTRRDLVMYASVVVVPWVATYLMQHVRWTPVRVQAVLMTAMIAAALLSAVMVFQVAPGRFDVSFNRMFTLDRNAGFYLRGDETLGPNAVAFLAAAGFAIALTYLKFFSAGSLVTYAILLIDLAFLLVAGGRNALVSTTGLLLLFSVTGRREVVSLRALGIGAVVLTVVGVTLVGLLQALMASHGAELRERVMGLVNLSSDHNTQVRVTKYWAHAIVMIAARPSGWGFDAYFARYGVTPHNEILGQLVGGGVLGTLGFGLVMLAVGVHAIRRFLSPSAEPWRQAAHYAAFSLLAVTVLAMVTEHISRSGRGTIYPLLWVCVGLSYGVAVKPIRKRLNPAVPLGPAGSIDYAV